MKLLIFTTQTTHHTKFVQDLCTDGFEVKAILEMKGVMPPFDVSHSYLDEQNQYEKDVWFDGRDVLIRDLVETIEVESVNGQEAEDFIKTFAPDLIVVFGTGKILPNIIGLMPDRILNLHGGDPEQYRGLDTHLWAIYHGEFDQLITCLHKVAPDLDAGDVVGKMSLTLEQRMNLYQLRAENTRVCIALVKQAISDFKQNGFISFEPQSRQGRYYSFMPSVIKDLCVKKFGRYTRDLS